MCASMGSFERQADIHNRRNRLYLRIFGKSPVLAERSTVIRIESGTFPPRWHPRLMIAGYHKTWDFWEVPERMLEAGYRVYLRSYMHHLSFVFYGN